MYYFIVNPAAGNGRIIPLMNRFKQLLTQKGILGEFTKTTSRGDAAHLARIAIRKGYSTVIAVGGDATVSEVLNGIAGTDTVLGVIPMGENNYLAKRLGISMNWKQSIEEIAARRILKMDVGKVVEYKTYFLLSVGIGSELEIKEKEEKKKSMFFKNPYKKLFQISPFKMKAIIDRSYQISAIANNISIVNAGFTFNILPQKEPFHIQDQLLDCVLLIPESDKKNILGMSSDIEKNISRIKVKEIYIESQLRKDVHADGHIIGKTPVTISIAPFSQKIIVGNALPL